MKGVEHLNPEGLPRNPAFSQAVVVTGPHRTIYVGGQNAVDEHEQIVGRGDIAAQTRQIFSNLRRVLRAGGADLEHVVNWNVYVVQGEPIGPALAVFQEEWGERSQPPAISMVYVAALANPEFLAEIEAIAVVPE
jgi:enamine deaminase RidA (YjgF/YER057c/UK114 family)